MMQSDWHNDGHHHRRQQQQQHAEPWPRGKVKFLSLLRLYLDKCVQFVRAESIRKRGLLVVALGLLILNVVSPTYPAIRCKGNVTHDPDISHKFLGDTVTTSMILTVSLLFPFIELLIAEWIINKEPQNVYEYPPMSTTRYKRALVMAMRWYRDYFFGIGFMILMNDIAKTTIGSPRPHWIDSCTPKFRAEDCQLGWVHNYSCTSTKYSQWRLADSRKSFPSGHSALSFYEALFMIFYQTNRLRVRRCGSVVMLFLHGMWCSWAIYCALSRISDHRHHPIDVLGGGLLGAGVSMFVAVALCGSFRKAFSLETYQSKVVSGLNGNATILEGFSTSPCRHDSKDSFSPSGTPVNGGGPPRLNGDMKRPSLRRLLSTQSNMTTMSEIAEDRELDNL